MFVSLNSFLFGILIDITEAIGFFTEAGRGSWMNHKLSHDSRYCACALAVTHKRKS